MVWVWILVKTNGLFGIYKVEPITCWDKLDKGTDKFEFNHIENGHTQEWKPTPKSDFQRQHWINQAWRREYAYLIDGVVR